MVCKKINYKLNWDRRPIPINQPLRKQRERDYEFRANLGCREILPRKEEQISK